MRYIAIGTVKVVIEKANKMQINLIYVLYRIFMIKRKQRSVKCVSISSIKQNNQANYYLSKVS